MPPWLPISMPSLQGKAESQSSPGVFRARSLPAELIRPNHTVSEPWPELLITLEGA
jgi:hypothetical protein